MVHGFVVPSGVMNVCAMKRALLVWNLQRIANSELVRTRGIRLFN